MLKWIKQKIFSKKKKPTLEQNLIWLDNELKKSIEDCTPEYKFRKEKD